jgi:hypothetical protein
MNAGAPTPDIKGQITMASRSECFQATSFSRLCLSQNVRLIGGSNQVRGSKRLRLCFVIPSELRISYYAALINGHVCGFL